MRRVLLTAMLGISMFGCSGERSSPRVQLLAPPTEVPAEQPRLTRGADGSILLSWVEPGVSPRLRAARFDGRKWIDPITVCARPTRIGHWADTPLVLASDGPALAATWVEPMPGGEEATALLVSASTDGGAHWSEPVRPYATTAAAEFGFGSLFSLPHRFGVAWLDGRAYAEGPESSTAAARLSASYLSDGPAHERVLDPRVCDCCPTSIATSGADVYLAYRDRSPEDVRDIHLVRGRIEADSVAWSGETAVAEDGWRVAGCPVNGPAVVAREKLVAVAWYSAANDEPRVAVAFSNDAGATFGAPLRVDGGSPVGRVGLALTGEGDAAVVWVERPTASAGGSGKPAAGAGTAILARRVAADGRLGATLEIAALPAGAPPMTPRIATADARAIVAWTATGTSPRVQSATVVLAKP